MSTRRPYAASMAIIALAAISACQKKESETAAPAKPAASAASAAQTAASAPAAPASTPVAAAAPQPNPERNAYFGETHLHTSWSVDAWVMGNRITGPADAYQYAQGATIKHPMGFDIKIDTPLDFMGVTDHSEYVGVTKQANTPGSYVSTLPAAQPMIMKDPTSAEEQNRVFSYILKLNSGAPVKALMDPKVTSTVWKENVQIADQQNKPGKFTAFCSYEWTSMPDNRNMHRNVFFRDCAKVPEYPFSSLDSTRPTDLWNWMDTQRKAGNELLAISHNANVSDGWMFPVDVDNTTGRPIDAAWAAARDAQ
jgi:opacity protein-like surface antigen